MANSAAQMNELDAIFAEVDALDALDSLDELEFDVEEQQPVVEEEAVIESAQEELTADLDDVEEQLELESEIETPAEVEAEVSIDEVEAELKTAEREARLEKAALSEEEAEASKMSIGKEASKKLAKTPKAASLGPKEAINVSDVLDSKVVASEEHWGFLIGASAEETKSAILKDCETIPKKTREKVVNLMDWWVRGHSLSVYTSIAMELLLEEGSITSTTLRNRYLSNPGKSYTMGTANAQTGQVIKLLKLFGITSSDGELVADHGMVKRFADVKKSA